VLGENNMSDPYYCSGTNFYLPRRVGVDGMEEQCLY
jgi:hypothetical protein